MVTTTTKIPSSDKILRSFSTILPISPTPIPSTKTFPAGTCPVAVILPLEISITSPLPGMKILEYGIPNSCANSA